MDFFTHLSNIFHGIGGALGSLVGGGPNKPDNTSNPVTVAPQPRPVAPAAPTPQPAVSSQQPPQIPGINLYQGPQKVNPGIMRNQLVATPQPAQPPAPANAQPTGLDRGISTVADATARAAIGIPQGIGQLWDMMTPGKGTSQFTKNMNSAAQEIDRDQQQQGVRGVGGNALYKGLQIGENVAPMIGGAVELAPKIPGLVKAIPDAVKAIPDMVKTAPDAIQAAGDAVDSFMNKVTPANLLNKANTATDITTPVQAGIKAPDEVGIGIKSVNPNQAADAAQQVAEKQAAQAGSTAGENLQPSSPEAAPQRTAPSTAETPTPPPNPEALIGDTARTPEAPTQPATLQPQPVPPTQSSNPSQLLSSESPLPNNVAQSENAVNTRPEAELQSQIEQAHNAGDTAKEQALVKQLPDQAMNPNAAPLSAEQKQVLIDRARAQASGKTAPNAPDVQAGFKQELGTQTNGEHEISNVEAMQNRAQATAQNTDLKAAITQHSGQVPAINSEQDAYDAAALLRRMYSEAKDDPAARTARNNLVEGIASFATKQGQGLRTVAELTQNMTPDVKAGVFSKSIEKMWGDALDSKAPPELRSLDGRSRIESTLTNYFEDGENIDKQLAAAKGQLDAAGQAVGRNGLRDADALYSHIKNLELSGVVKDAEVKNYLNHLVPPDALTERLAQGSRTSMLSSLFGRLSNGITVGGNTVKEVARSELQAAIGKAINAVHPDANAMDTGLLNRRFFSSIGNNAKRVGMEALHGPLAEGADQTVWNKGGASSARNILGTAGKGSRNTVLRKAGSLVKAAVGAPRTVFGGSVREAQLYRLALQAGKSLGKTGDDLKLYAIVHSAAPSEQLWTKAQDLQDIVSHTNANAFTKVIDDVFNTKSTNGGTLKGVVQLIKNAVLPFAKFPTTMLYNQLTDNNVLADIGRIGLSASRQDVDGFTKALSGLVLDGAGGAAAWHLARMGLITTNDGNGYSDAGMYLHWGNSYIPLGLFGNGAESLIGGASMYHALQAGGNVMGNYVHGIVDTLLGTGSSVGAQSLIGGNNPVVTQVQEAAKPNSGVNGWDAAATAGTQFIGQNIPAVFGDINAGLNMIPGVNPSGNAPLTKVTKGQVGDLTKAGKPSTAKDIPASDALQLAARIPGINQILPRDTSKAATNIFDRITRGMHLTAAQVLGNQQQAEAQQKIASDIKNGIPNPDYKYPAGTSFADDVESKIEAGNYDNAVKGLQMQLADYAKKGLPATKTQPIKDQIAQLGILKSQGLPASFRDAYSQTTLSEWRSMGDPASSNYNPAMYQKLWSYDQALADAGIAKGGVKPGTSSTQKFSTKASSSSSAASKAAALVKSNTIKAPTNMARESFVTNLSAKPITARIPQIKLTPPQGLIKDHSISVRSAHGNYN